MAVLLALKFLDRLSLSNTTYETPVKLNAKSAILVASDRPLMEGEPVHDAALITLSTR